MKECLCCPGKIRGFKNPSPFTIVINGPQEPQTLLTLVSIQNYSHSLTSLILPCYFTTLLLLSSRATPTPLQILSHQCYPTTLLSALPHYLTDLPFPVLTHYPL